jgi:hypothetical protein
MLTGRPARRGKSRPVGEATRRVGTIIMTVQPMPTRRHYRRPNPDRRRALELLAGSRYGYTKAILRARGFSIDMLVELVKAGLATTKRERMVASRVALKSRSASILILIVKSPARCLACTVRGRLEPCRPGRLAAA